jgi:glutamyl-tRNA reductase
MRILCAGISHRTAGVALRERLALDADARAAALRDLARRWPEAECLALATCNRTELHLARGVHGHPRQGELRDHLRRLGRLSADEADAIYDFADGEAVRHLFCVAAGLDSLVPGEGQIVAQLKEAYSAAVSAGTARGVLNELVQAALHAGKEVRTATAIDSGKVSVASVAVDCVTESLGDLEGKCVVNVGAGKMNELMLRRLAELGAGRIVVLNRSADRARELAERCAGEPAPLETLPGQLAAADVVVTSTAAETPVITREMVADAQERRDARPLLIIDIAVPRDVAPAAADLPGVSLFNIDDLESVVHRTLRTREEERQAAEAVIARHVERFMEQLDVRHVAPTIDALYAYMRRVAEEELAAARKKLSTHDDADLDAEIIERVLHRTVRRIMHPAARNLRRAAGGDTARSDAAALRRLFELEEGG